MRDYSGALSVSVIGHVLLLLLLSFNLVFVPHKPAPLVKMAIEATIVQTTDVNRNLEREQQRQIEQQRQQDEQRRVEEERRKEEQRKLEVERIQLEEQRKLEADEKQRKEQEARRAEQQRKEEEVRRAEQQRKEKEQAAQRAEQQRKEDAERKRVAAEQARQADIRNQMASELAAEEERRVAVESGLLAQYVALITNRVERNWVKPASVKPGLSCEVYVKQIPGGEVVDVRIGECNGDAAVIRSIEAAVYRSSPLPTPGDPSLFERNLRFAFKPEE